jgi:hypothetical protein
MPRPVVSCWMQLIGASPSVMEDRAACKGSVSQRGARVTCRLADYEGALHQQDVLHWGIEGLQLLHYQLISSLAVPMTPGVGLPPTAAHTIEQTVAGEPHAS